MTQQDEALLQILLLTLIAFGIMLIPTEENNDEKNDDF